MSKRIVLVAVLAFCSGLTAAEMVRLYLRFSQASAPLNVHSTIDDIIARLRSHGLKFDPVYCTDENHQVQADRFNLAFLDNDPSLAPRPPYHLTVYVERDGCPLNQHLHGGLCCESLHLPFGATSPCFDKSKMPFATN
jgi:hypothetical protein